MEKDSGLSEEELRKLLHPVPSHQQVENALDKSFPGKKPKVIKELESYDDANFLVEMEDGSGGGKNLFLAKVHNGVESASFITTKGRSVIDFQNLLFLHLSQSGINTSMPIRTASGELQTINEFPVKSAQNSPCKLVLRLMKWVHGQTLASARIMPIELLMDAGQFLGRIHIVFDGIPDSPALEAANRYHAWDGKNTTDLEGYVSCIHNPKRRALVQSVLAAFQRELIDTGTHETFRKGVLQADFNDANIIMDDKWNVCGIIDFGDSVRSWRILDISVGMAYAMLSAYAKPGKAISAAAAMLRGYHAVSPLDELEQSHLRLLVACRLACSVTLGAYSYQQNPENKYLLFHAEPAWNALDLIWNQGSAVQGAIDHVFRTACQVPNKQELSCSDLDIPDPHIVDLLASVRPDCAFSRTLVKDNEVTKLPIISIVDGENGKLKDLTKKLVEATQGSFEFSLVTTTVPNIQGNLHEVARRRCEEAANLVGGPVITEVSSLSFHALNGFPGAFVDYFAGNGGCDGLLKILEGHTNKKAEARSIVAFSAGPRKQIHTFEGKTNGQIVPPRGADSYGWHPIFQPLEAEGLTYSEFTEGEDKNQELFHTYRAIVQLQGFLVSKETLELLGKSNRT